ncbi:MAG: hypothetical protein LBI28_13890 [Treponema sp.]|jgi:hypothetical protein|nr:hypothetical protein [Treponema sp.]
MNYNKKTLDKHFIIFLLSIFVIFIIILPLSVILLSDNFKPDSYFKLKLENEIKKDSRIVKLFSFERTVDASDQNIFHIGLELKDGKKIVVRARQKFSNIEGIVEIDNYNVWNLKLIQYSATRNSMYITNGIQRQFLGIMLDKTDDYFMILDNYIDCYDEIKLLIEKIYNEEQIPVGKDEIDKWYITEENKYAWNWWTRIENIDKWEDEELINYSGFILINEKDRAKIYVEKIERDDYL